MDRLGAGFVLTRKLLEPLHSYFLPYVVGNPILHSTWPLSFLPAWFCPERLTCSGHGGVVGGLQFGAVSIVLPGEASHQIMVSHIDLQKSKDLRGCYFRNKDSNRY